MRIRSWLIKLLAMDAPVIINCSLSDQVDVLIRGEGAMFPPIVDNDYRVPYYASEHIRTVHIIASSERDDFRVGAKGENDARHEHLGRLKGGRVDA